MQISPFRELSLINFQIGINCLIKACFKILTPFVGIAFFKKGKLDCKLLKLSQKSVVYFLLPFSAELFVFRKS